MDKARQRIGHLLPRGGHGLRRGCAHGVCIATCSLHNICDGICWRSMSKGSEEASFIRSMGKGKARSSASGFGFGWGGRGKARIGSICMV